MAAMAQWLEDCHSDPVAPTPDATYKPPKVWDESAIRTKHGSNRATAGARMEAELPVGKHPIQLYSMGTPNGVKPTIMLEEIIECGEYPEFDYDAHLLPISGAQFGSGFVAIQPNSKIPAMTDNTTPSAPFRVFESGAIVMYLAEKYPKVNLLPTDAKQRAECLSWVFWAIGSPPFLGGGYGHFFNYAPKNPTAGYLEYPIDRYAMEVKRQLSVLDQLLSERKYICGDAYTIADILIWPWYGATVLGRMYNDNPEATTKEFLAVHEYKHLLRWAKHLEESRPAVRRGRMVNRGQQRKFPGDSDALYKDLPNLPERHSKADWQPTKEELEQAAKEPTA
jgi:GST-like protein